MRRTSRFDQCTTMDIQKVYVKTRAEFGRQCVFDMALPALDVNIMPNPAEMDQYINRNHCHVGVQYSKKFALHEAQSSSSATKDTGFSHVEGGWPKEINPRDEETTMRFRRRVEKDELWAPKLHNLLAVMQHNVLQNGTMNIYQHYFDDMIATQLVQPIGLRTVNMYRDPETPKRPVTCISWAPDLSNRIAVAYCFLDYVKLQDCSNTVYIWDLENSNKPYMGLEPFRPCVSLEFNPRDPFVLVSGLMSGQVCTWDIRASKHAVQTSHIQHSHREYASSVKWLPSKSSSEFFSTSSDGRAMWWDTRQLRKPTEVMMFDLDYPNDPDIDRAIGVSCLNYGPMVGTKFMFGLENGFIVIGSRKGKTNAEKMALKLKSHYGRVSSVDCSILNPSVFLSVGDWRARIWIEDTREGCLVSTPFLRDYPTAGCWNKIRHSAFYVITATGQLLVWDFLQTLRRPVFTLQLCDEELTCLAPCEEGVFLTIGNRVGEVYLVEPSKFFNSFDKMDRALYSELLEKYSKETKAVDARLRELNLINKPIEKEVVPVEPFAKKKKGKAAGKMTKMEKGADPGSSRVKDKKAEKRADSRLSRVKEKKKLRDESPHVVEAEAKYFEAVHKGLEVFKSGGDPDVIPVLPEQVTTKKQDKSKKHSRAFVKPAKETLISSESVPPKVVKATSLKLEEKKKIHTQKLSSLPSTTMEQSSATSVPAVELESGKKTEKRKRRGKVTFKLHRPCEDEICKPKVCCRRLGWKGRKKERASAGRKHAMERPSISTRKTEGDPQVQRQTREILAQIGQPPTVLKEEVARAITEIRIANWRTAKKQLSTEEYTQIFGSIPVKNRTTPRDTGRRKIRRQPESRKKKRVPRRRDRIRPVIAEPCSLPKEKSIAEQLSEMHNIPTLELPQKEIKDRHYLDEYETLRSRVYPRISEFHLSK